MGRSWDGTIPAFLIGQVVEITAELTRTIDDPVDPGTITFHVRHDDAEEATVYTYPVDNITRISQGLYTLVFTPTVAGYYEYRFSSTGVGTAAGEGAFYVHGSNFTT